MAEKAKKLEQTRGLFKLRGFVKGVDRDNAFEESVRTDGTRAGETFRKLNLGIQTTDSNQIRVGLFSYEPEEVFIWNSAKKKKNKDYKGERIPYEQYLETKEILKENGDAVLQSRVGVEHDEKGKAISHSMTHFEAIEEIYTNIDNDDSVYVEGQVGYSSYKNKEDEDVTGINYNIEKFYKSSKPYDFDDEKYEPMHYYEQQFVYVDSMIDKSAKKLYVTGRIIDYRQNTVDAVFVVNYGDDESMGKLAKNINKKFQFGDLVTVFGEVLNESIETEVEDSEDDSILAGLGGKSQPSHASRTNVTYNREMTIDGVTQWEKKKYTLEDFEANETVVESKEDLSNELGGKAKKNTKDPFEEDEDSEFDPFADDEDDDSMPF